MANLRNDDTPGLLPPLPSWRREVRERAEAYRASHPRPLRGNAGRPPKSAESVNETSEQAADENARVLLFRHQPALLVMTATGSAEPIADPVPFPDAAPRPLPQPTPEPLPAAAEPTWSEAAGRDFLQLPLPMGSGAVPEAGRLPDDLAPPGLRFQAGLTDALIVLTAAVLFALAGWASQNFPEVAYIDLRLLLPVLVAVPAGLAALYLVLCAWAGGATVGMRCHGLAVRGWDGPLTPAARRRRGWASVVSLAALGLGFVWILCDRQHLSWHDAISRTCVVRAPADE